MATTWLRVIGFSTLMSLSGSALHARVWTDTHGRTIEAELISVTSGEIQLRRSDGHSFTLTLAMLSAEDRAFVEQAEAAKAAAQPAPPRPPAADGSELNTLLNLPLLTDDNLWDDTPAVVAKRLHLKVEGKNAHFEGYRVYPSPAWRVLGANALMISLQASEGRVTSITVQFANQGDFPAFKHCIENREPPTAGELKDFAKAIKHDFDALTTTLRAQLGEPKRERALAGGMVEAGQVSLTWEWRGHALTVRQEPRQMVLLKIVPVTKAGAARLADDQVRRMFKERITRRPGGDVILDQIPMVNQGPKGYCVPATFERYLRYAGIPADMYELASCGGNSFGSGTSFTAMAQGLADYVRRQGRGLEQVELDLNVIKVARYIDEGRPLIWGLYSTSEYNELANTNTEARQKAVDLTKWTPTPTKQEIERLYPEPGSAHACLIIGYNRTTKEIAVSDSWGPQFQERWIPATAAHKVSQNQYWVLAW